MPEVQDRPVSARQRAGAVPPCPIPRSRSGRHAARRRGWRRRGPGTASGSRAADRPDPGRAAGGAGRARACRSSCRSATAACWCRRSRSSAARPIRWRPIWPGTPDRPRGAALRRCAPVELRRLRRTRPAAGLQPQRLRRDAARPVRVGRQAAGGELRGRRPRPGLRRQAAPSDQSDGARAYREAIGGLRRDDATSTSGTPASTSTRSPTGDCSRPRAKAVETVRAQPRPRRARRTA